MIAIERENPARKVMPKLLDLVTGSGVQTSNFLLVSTIKSGQLQTATITL